MYKIAKDMRCMRNEFNFHFFHNYRYVDLLFNVLVCNIVLTYYLVFKLSSEEKRDGGFNSIVFVLLCVYICSMSSP